MTCPWPSHFGYVTLPRCMAEILIGRKQQMLPVLDVVREVYHGIRETLFDEYEKEVNADDDNTIARNVQEI
jgi:hypothetical protein